MNLLEVRNLSKSYGGFRAVSNVSFDVCEGELLALIGPNGAGKTTLIKLALALQIPAQGRVWRRPGLRVGYMPQRLHTSAALPLTVERFLRLGGASRAAVVEALVEVGLPERGALPLQSASGGELQRVLLAQALLRKPDLLVLDEPVQGVDLAGQTAMYELIAEVRNRHRCGVLMISHDLHWVMAKTDHVVCLNQHVCCEGHPEQVGNDPAYRALFGDRFVRNVALYQHHHDHRHDLHGDVVCQHDTPAATAPKDDNHG